jgi:hypothetical protein
VVVIRDRKIAGLCEEKRKGMEGKEGEEEPKACGAEKESKRE